MQRRGSCNKERQSKKCQKGYILIVFAHNSFNDLYKPLQLPQTPTLKFLDSERYA